MRAGPRPGVSGSTGCNTYNGSYTVTGSSIKISQLASTRKLCTDDAVNAQEAAILGALSGASTWAIGSDGNLTIKGAADIVAKPGA